MPARKVLSEPQWDFMLDYMQSHPAFAKGSCCNGPSAKQTFSSRWENLASGLNSVGTGCTKTPAQWREYWNNAKYFARKKACIIRQQLKGIGGSKRFLNLTKNEKRVLSILGTPLPVSCTQVKSPPVTPPPVTAPSGSSSSGTPPPVSPLPVQPPPVSPLPLKPPPVRLPQVRPTWAGGTGRRAIHGSTTWKQYRRAVPPVPEWVRQIEERRIAVEEMSARAMQGVQANTEYCASTLRGIQVSHEQMARTLQGIQTALEASARALQERLK